MVRMLLAVAFALMFLISACAAADPDLLRLDVSIVDTPATPLEQEMVLIELSGTYRPSITLHKLEQPEFRDMSWTQLGRDEWSNLAEDGLPARRFVRRYALFPQVAGTAEVPAFTHRLTILDRTGKRAEVAVKSAPLSFKVLRKPATGGWWIAARSLTLTDTSDRPLDTLGFGDIAIRTVSLEAKGINPESLPPQPTLTGAGVIAFPDPEERSVELTPEGPVSRVTWRWTVRLLAPDPQPLGAVAIPWFDTTARQMKSAVIPEVRVSLSGSLTANAQPALRKETTWPVSWTAALAGFGLGLAALLRGRRFRSRDEIVATLVRLLPDAELRAGRGGDLNALRRAARRLAPQPDAELAFHIAKLERALYGGKKSPPDFDRRRLAALLRRT